MIHAVVIDDEISGVKNLELLVNEYLKGIRIVASTTNPHEGISQVNDYRPDIVFLDIKMPNLDGFDVLDRLYFTQFHLVFTTAHQEFALRALKRNASDYLLKPVDVNELRTTVERIREKIESKQQFPDVTGLLNQFRTLKNTRVPLHSKTGVEYVLPSDIVMIRAESNRSHVLLLNGMQIDSGQPLKEYEILLCGNSLPFSRVHNSYLVNMNYVKRYLKESGGFVVMNNNKTIPVSKNKKEELFAWLNIGQSE
jgi:two-component system LytT family response regulator